MRIIKQFAAIVVLGFVASAGLAFAQVATVFELTGTATATASVPAGSPAAARTLRKGDGINQGESITTGASSSIVLRFQDGQIVSLSANSTFTVNTYTYNANAPENSNVLLSLVRGGMRAVSGLIAKARPQAVSYRAGSATIGIRGTDFTVLVADADGNVTQQVIAVTVTAGRISFTLGTQTVEIPVGSGAIVRNPQGNPTVAVQTAAQVQQALATEAAKNPALQSLVNAVVSLNIQAMDMLVAGAQSRLPARIFTATELASGYQQNANMLANSGTGGGSTLPLCSAVVSPISGTNCRSN
jgi:hypothetical protein